ncbi:MAG: 2-C-methyl-D-erythritol 2,4-cyclodiphosphate synthase, partial [Candidatus Riflebacteria bacterium]|nr:2-C-methyl-D-erythritol 2,4-cyclodiphosphate synthase [Candidatus Riflebacteria bacterium]
VPYHLGLKGHSDADALIHAIMDAMLGALAMGDIGGLFPDNDSRFKDVSSVLLLREVVKLTLERGYKVGNLDCMIHCERPRIAPHRPAMISVLSEILQIPAERISIKAGTNEGFDAVGQGSAISCQAIALMIKE